jgi:type IV/VI secretion system ImpK/VasF family protein
VLIVASQLGTGSDDPTPDRLRDELTRLLRQMVAKCRASRIPDGDTAEARYALVAFIDDRILKSNWVGRAEWMKNPLQLQLYREYAAGENFFARMRAIQQRDRHAPALEAYHLCLALGFTGALQGDAIHQAQTYLDSTRDCAPRLVQGAPLSPHAVPPDQYGATAPRRPVVLLLSIGCFLVVVLGLGLLSWSLGRTLERVQRDIDPRNPRLSADVAR